MRALPLLAATAAWTAAVGVGATAGGEGQKPLGEEPASSREEPRKLHGRFLHITGSSLPRFTPHLCRSHSLPLPPSGRREIERTNNPN